jgi:uncharacterized protein DUF5670
MASLQACATQPALSTTTVRANPRSHEKEIPMFLSSFLIVFIALFVAWVFAWFVFHVAGALIHLLLVVAVICLILHFARGRP